MTYAPNYRALVELCTEAVPFIMEHYSTDQLPWEYVLEEIAGIRMMEDPGAHNPLAVKQRWLEWWAAQR